MGVKEEDGEGEGVVGLIPNVEVLGDSEGEGFSGLLGIPKVESEPKLEELADGLGNAGVGVDEGVAGIPKEGVEAGEEAGGEAPPAGPKRDSS